MLMQFLPLLLMIVFFGLFSSTPESPYSMTATDKHKFVQKSYNLHVPFFVTNKYSGLSTREKHSIQNQIEREHLQSLQTRCEAE